MHEICRKEVKMKKIAYVFLALLLALIGAFSIYIGIVVYLGVAAMDAKDVVGVDSSFLRLANKEFAVSNEIVFCVTVRGDACETVFLDGYDGDVCMSIGDRKLAVKQEEIVRYGADGMAEESIPASSPVQLRIWRNGMTIAGSRTWSRGMIRLGQTFDKTKIVIRSSSPFCVTVASNWYYW